MVLQAKAIKVVFKDAKPEADRRRRFFKDE
jgi:hypothetical protein